MKKLDSENPCRMDLFSRGGGSTESTAIYWFTGSRTTNHAFLSKLQSSKAAFTMAEILLSLTIIGVVAAITLPSLTGNINERTWNTQRKALYARFSQAIALMPSLNGYGTLTSETESASAVDTAAETFVTSGLSKVLKINNICDSDHLNDCGLSSKITTMNGSIISFPNKMSELNSLLTNVSASYDYTSFSALNTKAAAFETLNGESIAVYYNPNCQTYMNENSSNHDGYYYFIYPKICANFVFDLNGSKGPNTVGKDIGFITALYSSDSVVVSPQLPNQMAANTENGVTQQAALGICKSQDSELRLPNIEELVAIFTNQNLLYGREYSGSVGYWSSNPGLLMGMESAAVWHYNRNIRYFVHCVER